MSTPITVPCVRYPECEKRYEAIARRIDGIDERVRTQGESIAALRAQVAMWAALGALLGGGVVSVAVNLLSRGS